MDASSADSKSPRPIGFAPPFMDEATIDAVSRVLRSGWITTGPETAAFEDELAEFCGADRVVCGGSWTGLAGVVLDWFGVGPGDEVILPAYTYCATANVVLHRGATPVLVDLPETGAQDGLNLTWAAVEPHLNERTKVVMPVDIGGWPVPCGDWQERLAEWYSSRPFHGSHPVQEALGRPLLLSDAAHSLGATVDGQPVGSLADLSIFSFHAVKNLTTAEGGAVAICLPDSFDPDEVHRALRTTALHGQSKDAAAKYNTGGAGAWRYDVDEPGFKCNMTDIQAAMGRVALARYRRDLEIRRTLGDRYDAGFAHLEGAILPLRHEDQRSSSDHLYALRLPHLDEAGRDGLMAGLSERGIASNVHFQPLPLLSAYRKRGFRAEDCPNALAAYGCEISLPLHLHMELSDVDRVVHAVRDLLPNGRPSA